MNTIKLSGHVKITDLNTGKVLVDGENIVTDVGREEVGRMIAGPISGEIIPTISQMSLGNGGTDPSSGIAIAPAPSQNSLENIILTDPSIDTVTLDLTVSIKKVIFTTTFDSSNVISFGTFEPDAASETGLFSSSGKLFAVKNFDRKVFDGSIPSILQITWTIFIP